MKKYFSLILILIIIILTYFTINLSIGKSYFSNIKNVISDSNRQLLKKYIFPYKLIDQQEKEIFIKNQKLILQNEIIKQKEDIKPNKPNFNDELIFKNKLMVFAKIIVK